MKKFYICLVCGWRGLENELIEPFQSHEICSCCGTQYGLDVIYIKDVWSVRKEWLNEGAQWFDDEDYTFPAKPKNWGVEKALTQIKAMK